MDFTLTDEQLAVSEAAGGLFAGLVDAERIAGRRAEHRRIDRELWKAAGRRPTCSGWPCPRRTVAPATA